MTTLSHKWQELGTWISRYQVNPSTSDLENIRLLLWDCQRLVSVPNIGNREPQLSQRFLVLSAYANFESFPRYYKFDCTRVDAEFRCIISIFKDSNDHGSNRPVP